MKWIIGRPRTGCTEFLNRAAPLGSTVVVVGPGHIVEHYARPDLQIEEYSAKNPKVSDESYYSVILTRHNKDQSLFPEAIQVFSIGGKIRHCCSQIDRTVKKVHLQESPKSGKPNFVIIIPRS